MNAQEHHLGQPVTAVRGGLVGTIVENVGDGYYHVQWPGYGSGAELIHRDRIMKSPQGRRIRAPTNLYAPDWPTRTRHKKRKNKNQNKNQKPGKVPERVMTRADNDNDDDGDGGDGGPPNRKRCQKKQPPDYDSTESVQQQVQEQIIDSLTTENKALQDNLSSIVDKFSIQSAEKQELKEQVEVLQEQVEVLQEQVEVLQEKNRSFVDKKQCNMCTNEHKEDCLPMLIPCGHRPNCLKCSNTWLLRHSNTCTICQERVEYIEVCKELSAGPCLADKRCRKKINAVPYVENRRLYGSVYMGDNMIDGPQPDMNNNNYVASNYVNLVGNSSDEE